jgi:hypothetical protein
LGIVKKQQSASTCCTQATDIVFLVPFKGISFAPLPSVWFNRPNFPNTGVGPGLRRAAWQATAPQFVVPEPYV